MRKEIKEINIYKYEELSTEAKEKVKETFQEWRQEDTDIFEMFTMEDIKESYPKSDFQIQFSLSSCQGDGFNIYSDLNLYDFLYKYENKFRPLDFQVLKNVVDYYIDTIDLKANNRYCYSKWNLSYFDDIIDSIDYTSSISDKPKCFLVVKKFVELICEEMHTLCKKLEKSGYDYFYEDLEEEYIIEMCDINNYEFLEDGTIY